MLKHLFVTLIIVLAGQLVSGQQHHFSLGDSTFVTGTTYRSYEIRFIKGQAAFAPESEIFLNNIVKFLRYNPKVQVEIGGHVDDKSPKGLGLRRANALKQYCMEAGIHPDRMTTFDYKNSDPIREFKEIMRMKDKEEKEAARSLNHRLELKILSNDFEVAPSE